MPAWPPRSALVWVVGLFLQLSSLESRYGQLKQQMAEVFHEAVPQEAEYRRTPWPSFSSDLDALRKEREPLTSLRPDRPAPLEIL